MKIVVAIKQVAALDEDFEMREDGRGVDPDFFELEINEWDEFSLETALQLKEANEGQVEVVAVTVGDDDAEDVLRAALAKGVDKAIRVWDDEIEGSDASAIARILAKVAEKEGADMVFAGALSSDHSFAQTGVSIAANLDWSHVAVVNGFEYTPGAAQATVRRELEGGVEEEIAVNTPCVLTIQLGINEPRYASLRGIKQAAALPIEELSHADLGLDDDQVGEAGSLSRVRRMFTPEKGRAEMIEGTAAEQAARIAEIIKELRA